MSAFDPASFLNMQTTEVGSTSVEPIPAGEYMAIISDLKPREANTKNGPKAVLDLELSLQAPDVAAKLGRSELKVRDSVWPDMRPDGAGLDMSKGKNVKLNRIREAAGLNKPGQTFSVGMLLGKMVKVQVAHRVDGDAIYTDVKTYGAAG